MFVQAQTERRINQFPGGSPQAAFHFLPSAKRLKSTDHTEHCFFSPCRTSRPLILLLPATPLRHTKLQQALPALLPHNQLSKQITHLSPTESSPRGSRRFFLLDSVTLKPSGNQSWPCSLRRLRFTSTPSPMKASRTSAATTTYIGYSWEFFVGSAVSPTQQWGTHRC